MRNPASSPITPTAKGLSYSPDHQLAKDIHEVNLLFLRLMRRWLHADAAGARAAIGISEPVAQHFLSLSDDQLLRMARSSLLVCRFRCVASELLAALGPAVPAEFLALCTGAHSHGRHNLNTSPRAEVPA